MSRQLWFAITCAAYAVMLVVAWFAFPERVPVHFGGDGQADRILGPERATLEAALLGLFLAAVFVAAAELANASSQFFNVRNKDFWTRPENLPRLRAMVREDMYAMGALVMLLLTAVLGIVILVARAGTLELGLGGFLVVGAVALSVVGYALYLAIWRYRVPSR